MKPLISIIVPVYNVEKYAKKCTNSLCNQTFENYEIIFVNDASTDKSFEIIESEIAKNKSDNFSSFFIHHEFNKGVVESRRTGLNQALGKYILFVDSDDYLDLDMLEKMYQSAIENDSDIVTSDMYLEYPDYTDYFSEFLSTNALLYFKDITFGNYFSHSLCNKLVKKELYTISFEDLNFRMTYYEDKFVCIRLYYFAKKITKIDRAFYHYLKFNQTSSTKTVNNNTFESLIYYWDKLEDFLKTKRQFNQYIDEICYNKTKDLLKLFIKSNNYSLIKKYTNLYGNLFLKKSIKLRFGEQLALYTANRKMFFLTFVIIKLIYLKNKKIMFLNHNKVIKKFILAFLILFFSSTIVYSIDYRTIPLAQSIELKDGFTFTINENVRISVVNKSKAQKRNAEFLQSFVSEKLGLQLKIASGSKKAGVIILSLDTTISHPEGYKINIEKYKVKITGKTEAGVFYGIQTLCKSIPDTSGIVQLAPVQITDAPRFNYRGMHLDVARHFFSVDFVKKYIDMLALHHVNTFHWHLTEDQGWRIEIKKYPFLTKIGSKRAQTVVGHRKSGKYDSIPYSGFYTQKQIKEVVRYANERYITIVPEIDMPGHMLAALTAYPELGCTGGPYKVAETWGIFDDVLCPGNEKTFEFVENVLSEVIRLFPSKYIHIGGDECLKTKWKVCPKCQERIKSEGLNTDSLHLQEHKLQSYFITRVEKFVNSKGRQIIGWDEILEGGLAPNATVMSWRGIKGGIQAAKSNHKVIMTPNSHLYFDHYQAKDKSNEPLAIGGYSSVEIVYNYEPIPAELNETEAKYVIGSQANLWTEYIATEQQAEYMLLPRLAALSEVQWTKAEQKNYADFLARLPNLTETYEKRGYNFAKHVLKPTK